MRELNKLRKNNKREIATRKREKNRKRVRVCDYVHNTHYYTFNKIVNIHYL